MGDETLFVIDSTPAGNGSMFGGDDGKILFDSLPSTGDGAASAPGAAPSAATPTSIGESFIGVEKPIPAHLAVAGRKKQVDPTTRTLQHAVDVRGKIYFSADPTSLLSYSSKNRIRGGGVASVADSSSSSSSSVASSSSSSSSSSKADLLVASLLEKSSSAGDSRSAAALSTSVVTNDFGQTSSPSSSYS